MTHKNKFERGNTDVFKMLLPDLGNNMCLDMCPDMYPDMSDWLLIGRKGHAIEPKADLPIPIARHLCRPIQCPDEHVTTSATSHIAMCIHVYRHVHRRVYRHVYRHVYR